MFYDNNPIANFLDSFYDKSQIGLKQLDPEQQFAGSTNGVEEFNTVYKNSFYQQIIEQIGGSITNRANLFARLRNFKDDPIAIMIIDIFIEDAFSQTDNRDFYQIEYQPNLDKNGKQNKDKDISGDKNKNGIKDSREKDIKKEIADLEDKFKLKAKFKNVLPDLLLLGEYMWSTEYKQGEGLVSITDNVLVDNVLGIYKNEETTSYVELTQQRLGTVNQTMKELPKDSILHMVLNPGKIRFFITDCLATYTGSANYTNSSRWVSGWNNSTSRYSSWNTSNTLDDPSDNYRMPNNQPPEPGAKMLSKYVGTGRSVLYSSLKYLERLSLLDMTNLALLLKRTLTPTIMTLQVPDSYSYKKALQAAQSYTQLFYDTGEDVRNLFQSNGQNNINFNKILELSQKFTAMPVWGDGKGTLQSLDLVDTRDNREAIDDIKRDISNTSGLPYYYFIPDQGGIEKKETLKTHARYARKLHELQQSVANPIIETHYNNLKYKGYDIDRDDLVVTFKSIVNSDALENIEQIINLFTAINEIVVSLDNLKMSQSLNVEIITKEFMKYFRHITDPYPFISAIVKESNKPKAEMIDPNMMYNQNPEDVIQPAIDQYTIDTDIEDQRQAMNPQVESFADILLEDVDIPEDTKKLLIENKNKIDSISEQLKVNRSKYRFQPQTF